MNSGSRQRHKDNCVTLQLTLSNMHLNDMGPVIRGFFFNKSTGIFLEICDNLKKLQTNHIA